MFGGQVFDFELNGFCKFQESNDVEWEKFINFKNVSLLI